MHDKIAKFTEAPRTSFGTAAGPWSELRTPGPMWATFLGMTGPSKTIKPQHRIERHVPSVHVRMWFASESGSIWMSPGYYTIRLDRFVALKARSWWRKRFGEPIPQARTVRR